MQSDTLAKVADQTDYAEGIAVKGKGQPTDYGFIMYQVPLYIDLAIEITRLWEDCMIDEQMNAVGKAFTSFAGALDILITGFWRYFSEEDGENFLELSQAVIDNDPNRAGAAFGKFMKAFLKVENRDQAQASDYQEVGYLQ